LVIYGEEIMTYKEYGLKMIANYHTHTTRCRHAVGEDREYVEAAIEAGLEILGFADHTPYPTGTDFKSGMRIPLELADDYFTSITSLRDEYKNDIKIYVGVEAEYFPAHFDKLMDFMKDYPLDYMILGNHFVPEEHHGAYVGADFTDKRIIEMYADNLIEGIKTGKFAYVAHPDLPAYVGEDMVQVKTDIYHKICKAAKEYDIPLEINMLGHMRQIQYPSDLFFNIASEYKNDVIVGMDIHKPSHFGKLEALKYCIEMADRFGLNRVDTIDMEKSRRSLGK